MIRSGGHEPGASYFSKESVPLCADKELSEALVVPERTPLLELRNIVNGIYGVPIIYAQEFFWASKFKFIITRGKL